MKWIFLKKSPYTNLTQDALSDPVIRDDRKLGYKKHFLISPFGTKPMKVKPKKWPFSFESFLVSQL